MQHSNVESEKSFESSRIDLSKLTTKRETLKKMCVSLLEKTYDHYLIHQQFIDEEQRERTKLSELF